MRSFRIILICSCVLIAAAGGLAAEAANGEKFAISADAKAKLTKDVKESYTVLECDASSWLRKEKATEKWVSGKFNLNRADVRDSKKFPGRRVYQLPANEAGAGVNELFVKDKNYTGYVKETALDASDILAKYPRAAGPKDTLTKDALTKDATAKKALAFLRKHGLISETDNDKIGQTIVRERKRNLGEKDGNPEGTDVVISEYVRCVRHVDGMPVLNSFLSVEFDALSGEVISLEQENWTPVAPAAVKRTVRTNKKSNEMVEWVRQRAHKRLGNRMSVKLKDVKQAWFQTEDRLVPVLVCNVGAFDSEGDGTETQKFTDIINLTDDPGIPDKWSETKTVWPKEPPPEYPDLDAYGTYR